MPLGGVTAALVVVVVVVGILLYLSNVLFFLILIMRLRVVLVLTVTYSATFAEFATVTAPMCYASAAVAACVDKIAVPVGAHAHALALFTQSLQHQMLFDLSKQEAAVY